MVRVAGMARSYGRYLVSLWAGAAMPATRLPAGAWRWFKKRNPRLPH